MSEVAAREVDLADYIDGFRWTVPQLLMVVLGGLAFTIDGLANQILGVAMPALIQEWGVTREALAPVAATGLIGLMIGAIVGGRIGDKIGRRRGLIGAIFLFSTMTVLAAFADSPTLLALIRFIDGLGIGAAIPNCAALLIETAPKRRRALALAFSMMFMAGGGLLTGLLGAAILPTMGWQALFLLVGIGGYAVAVLFAFVLPESPSFLVGQAGAQDRLRKVVTRLTGPVAPDIRFVTAPTAPHERRWMALLHRDVRRTSISIWVGFLCCLLGTYMIFSWLPTLLHGYGFTIGDTSVVMSAFNGGAMIGGFASGFIMQRYGPRIPTLILALVAAAITFAIATLHLKPSEFLFVLTIFSVLGLLLAGLHNGFYTLATLAYAPVMRASGIGAAAAFGRVGAIASSYVGVLAMQIEGTAAYFAVIGVALVIAAISVALIRSSD